MRGKRRTWTSWDDKAELSAPRNPRFLRPELFPRFKGIGRETHSGDAPKQIEMGGGVAAAGNVWCCVLRQVSSPLLFSPFGCSSGLSSVETRGPEGGRGRMARLSSDRQKWAQSQRLAHYGRHDLTLASHGGRIKL